MPIRKVPKIQPIGKITSKANGGARKTSSSQKATSKLQSDAITSQELREISQNVAFFKQNPFTARNVIIRSDNARKERSRTQLKEYYVGKKADNVLMYRVRASGLSGYLGFYNVALSGISKEDDFDKTPIRVSCSCSDFTYRFRYIVSSVGGVVGFQEHRVPRKTNPSLKGVVCKHLLFILNKYKTNNLAR